MPPLFHPKEHDCPVPGLDSLPPEIKLNLAIKRSGVITFVENLFQSADLIANLSEPNDWKKSQITTCPNDDPDDPWITYVATQTSLLAISERISLPSPAKQRIPFLSVLFSFKFQTLGQHIMKIEGHEVTYEGPMPEDFTQETTELQEITDAFIQAMMKPMVFTPDPEV